MRRSILFLTLGVFCAALLVAVATVYLFHDVDHDQIGHLNSAFAGLCSESVLFALIVGSATGLLASLGRFILRLMRYSPRAMLGFWLGVGVTVLQYPWDFAARKMLPRFGDSELTVYLVVAIALCSVVLLRDCFKQKKAYEAVLGSFPN